MRLAGHFEGGTATVAQLPSASTAGTTRAEVHTKQRRSGRVSVLMALGVWLLLTLAGAGCEDAARRSVQVKPPANAPPVNPAAQTAKQTPAPGQAPPSNVKLPP